MPDCWPEIDEDDMPCEEDASDEDHDMTAWLDER